MDTFGLKTLADLPKIKEFELPENEIGVRTDEESEPIVQIESSNNPEVMDLAEDSTPIAPSLPPQAKAKGEEE